MRYIYLVACLALLLILPYQSNASQPNPSPAFLLSAHAGLAAYFYTPAPLDLDHIRPVFYTVEHETADYIWGSYALAGRTDRLKMLAMRSGLVLVAHDRGVHAGQLFDCGWGINGTSQLSKGVNELATALKVEPEFLYFDFRNPTATGLTRVWHYQNSGGTHSYNVFLPLENSYLDSGFHVCSVTNSSMTVNGEVVFSEWFPPSGQLWFRHGVLTGQQLRAGQDNGVTMSGMQALLARGFTAGVATVYEGGEPVVVTDGDFTTWPLVSPDVGELVRVYRVALPVVLRGDTD